MNIPLRVLVVIGFMGLLTQFPRSGWADEVVDKYGHVHEGIVTRFNDNALVLHTGYGWLIFRREQVDMSRLRHRPYKWPSPARRRAQSRSPDFVDWIAKKEKKAKHKKKVPLFDPKEKSKGKKF